MKKVAQKITTIEDLAAFTASGFAEVHLKMSSGFRDVNKHLEDLETRMVSLEALQAVILRHDRTIDKLVDNMRLVKTALHLR